MSDPTCCGRDTEFTGFDEGTAARVFQCGRCGRTFEVVTRDANPVYRVGRPRGSDDEIAENLRGRGINVTGAP